MGEGSFLFSVPSLDIAQTMLAVDRTNKPRNVSLPSVVKETSPALPPPRPPRPAQGLIAGPNKHGAKRAPYESPNSATTPINIIFKYLIPVF